MQSVCFDIYHYKIKVNSVFAELLSRLKKDFSYYQIAELPGTQVQLSVDVNIESADSELRSLPFRSLFRSADHYDYRQFRVLRYDSEHFVVKDFQKKTALVIGRDLDCVHEIVYLLILSRWGKELDQRGMHRLHAACFILNNRPLTLVLDSGVGKSTLSILALLENKTKLYSDDSPLISKNGEIFPFHLRIGVSEKSALDNFEKIYTYSLERKRYGTKWLLDTKALQSQLAVDPITQGNKLVFGRRESGRVSPKVERIGRTRGFFMLIVPMMVGYGLPVLLEYFWETGWRDFCVKIKIALSRVRAARALTQKSDCYFVHFTDDATLNMQALRQL